MSLNSKAVFQARVKECQLYEYWNRFEALGWTTMGAFAFSANHQPGSPDETSFLNEVVIPVVGDVNHPLKAMLRRLHFEAFSMVAEEARRRASRTDDEEKPRKLPLAEKAVRLQAIQDELVGLDISGELEPSDHLVDRMVTMQEDGVLKFILWEDVGRRDVEVRGSKKDPWYKFDQQGLLHEYASI